MLQFVPELREFVAVFQGHELQHVPKAYYLVGDSLRDIAENFSLHSLTIIQPKWIYSNIFHRRAHE